MELPSSGSHNLAGNLPVFNSGFKNLHYGTQRLRNRYRIVMIVWVMTPHSLGETSVHLQGGSDSLDICSTDYVYNCLPVKVAIFGMCGGKCSRCSLLGNDTVQSRSWVQMFRRCILLSSSECDIKGFEYTYGICTLASSPMLWSSVLTPCSRLGCYHCSRGTKCLHI